MSLKLCRNKLIINHKRSWPTCVFQVVKSGKTLAQTVLTDSYEINTSTCKRAETDLKTATCGCGRCHSLFLFRECEKGEPKCCHVLMSVRLL